MICDQLQTLTKKSQATEVEKYCEEKCEVNVWKRKIENCLDYTSNHWINCLWETDGPCIKPVEMRAYNSQQVKYIMFKDKEMWKLRH